MEGEKRGYQALNMLDRGQLTVHRNEILDGIKPSKGMSGCLLLLTFSIVYFTSGFFCFPISFSPIHFA